MTLGAAGRDVGGAFAWECGKSLKTHCKLATSVL